MARGRGRPSRSALSTGVDAAALRRDLAQALALRRRLRRAGDALRGERPHRPARADVLGGARPGERRDHREHPQLLPAERGEVWTERGGGFDPWDLGTSGKGIRTRIDSKGTTARLRFRDPDEWVETICPTGEGSGDGGYVWTRKRPSTIELRMELADGRLIEDELRGIEDESAGYHPRQHRLELVGRGRHRRRRPRRRLEPGRGRQRPGGAQRAGDLDRRGSTPRARSRRLRGPRSGRLRRRLPPGFQGGGRTQRRPEHVPRQVEVPTALRHVQRFTGGDRAGRRHRRNGVPRGNLVTTRCPLDVLKLAAAGTSSPAWRVNCKSLTTVVTNLRFSSLASGPRGSRSGSATAAPRRR